MIVLFNLFSLLLFISGIFLITNHQGAAQKVIYVSFLLLVVCILLYINHLRRLKN